MKRALALSGSTLLTVNSVEALALALILSVLGALPAHAAKGARDRARETLLKRGPVAAVHDYHRIATATPDGALAAEYACVLAGAGFTDLGLAELDRAFLLAPADENVLYFGSQLLGSTGLGDAAKELSRPAPGWLSGGELPLGPPTRDRELGAFSVEFAAAQKLLLQRRFASAADRFTRITKKFPNEALGWSGLSIALEKLGAYKSAAAAVAKDLELSKKDDKQATLDVLAGHQKELEERPPLQAAPAPKTANQALKGRYLAFFGGSWTHSDAGSILNVNGRLGRFFTDRIDAGLNAGITAGYDDSDYNGLSLGLSGRYNQPIPGDMPVNATAGVRLQYVPAPSDRFSLFLSPGLSYFLTDSSVDLVLDIGVAGPLKNTVTLSIGYTTYFGGGR